MNDPRSNFRTVTRLETLATQAIRHGMQKQDIMELYLVSKSANAMASRSESI